MNPRVGVAILAALMLANIGIITVYASHTYIDGVVYDSAAAVPLVDGKVTAERAGEYKWDRTDSAGNYLLTASSTGQYYVDAMKTDHNRDRVWPFGGDTPLPMIVFDRGHPNVKWKVAYDSSTAVTRAEAVNWLKSAEPWFLEEHSINWNEWWAGEAFLSFDAADNCAATVEDMAEDVGWPGDHNDAQILIGFVDGQLNDGTAGCIPAQQWGPGTHPYIVVDAAAFNDVALVVMHEVSHAYGLPDGLCAPFCDDNIPGVMWHNAPPNILIKNWTPFDDNTMEQRRWWYCPTC